MTEHIQLDVRSCHPCDDGGGGQRLLARGWEWLVKWIYKWLVPTGILVFWLLFNSIVGEVSPRLVLAAAPSAMDFDRVLDPPVLRHREIVQDRDGCDWIEFELEWNSRWQGGPVDLRGTLFIDHRWSPCGRVLACRPDPCMLAQDPVFTVRIPMVSDDGSSRVLGECDLDQLVIHFASRR